MSLLVVAAMLQAATGSVSQDPAFQSLLTKYKACVRIKARQFETAKESVPDTANASLLACEGERASMILFMNAKKNGVDGSELWPVDKAERFVSDLIEQPLRTEVITGLFEIRSRK